MSQSASNEVVDGLRLGFLASGELGACVLESLDLHAQICFICTNRASVGVIEYATRHEIPMALGNPRNAIAMQQLGERDVDVLLSVNYMYLIEEDLITLPRMAAINFHGSLLPRYRGRTPHVWAIINGESETGITAHRIVPECDAGDILLQKAIPIGPNDTGASILSQFKSLYPQMVRDVLTALSSEKPFFSQNETLASYFGKRTPSDGGINWSWHRVRIRNWVRAQTPPYPGAFSRCHGRQIGVYWVEMSDLGFRDQQPNGLILSKNESSFFVKAPDGVLEVTDYEFNQGHLRVGDVLI